MYQLIPLHSFDYLKKISLKTNVVTDEANGRNVIWHCTNKAIGLAVKSFLLVQVELMER